MDKIQNAVVVPAKKQHQPTLKEAIKYIIATAVTFGGVQLANAAEISAVGQGLNGEIDAGKTIIISLFTAGAILLGIFAGYRYLKRGASSA